MGRLSMRLDDNGSPFIEVQFEVIETLKNGLEDDVFEKFTELAQDNGLTIEELAGFSRFAIKPSSKKEQSHE